VIVRIATEAQYRVDDGKVDELNELDNAVVQAVDSGDEAAFTAAYQKLIDTVRGAGTQLEDDDLDESDLILPPPDLTFAEAGEQFTGEGLIPDGPGVSA
jgi:hypothetical protein